MWMRYRTWARTHPSFWQIQRTTCDESDRWFDSRSAHRRPLPRHVAGRWPTDKLSDFDDVDNGLAICEFEGGKLACFYASRTMAHGHDTWTEVVGTGGKLTIGRDARVSEITLSDAHNVRFDVVQDFYARFADAFVAEANTFVAAVRDEQAVPLTLADATEATRIGHALAQAQRERRIVDIGL